MSTNLCISNSLLIQNDIIRTDFILENTFHYLLGNYYNFKCMKPINEKEKYILNTLIEILNCFRKNICPIKILCKETFKNKITENTIHSALLSIANELFSDGISWSRIIGFSVFAGELTIICIECGLPTTIVHVIYESYSEIVKEKLEVWVNDHGGWENISSLAVSNQRNLTKPNWLKHVFHTILRIIGTFTFVTSTFQNNF